LHAATQAAVVRSKAPSETEWARIRERVSDFNRAARSRIGGLSVKEFRNKFWTVASGGAPYYCADRPCTQGEYVFLQGSAPTFALLSHEYVHVLQYEGRGYGFGVDYIANAFGCGCFGPTNGQEAVPYLWDFWINSFFPYEAPPWDIWRRPS
jgi:hypothetical protein